VVTQVPPMLEAVTGVDLKGMIDRLQDKSAQAKADKKPDAAPSPKK
jgi:hypothetical protein